MATLTQLDTHVVAWLYTGHHDLLSPAAVQAIEQREIEISPMVTLELQYLHEIGRLTVPGREVVERLHVDIGLRSSAIAFAAVIAEAVVQRWTRDPFDRIIVGQALASGASLVTRDETIREHSNIALW